MAISLYGCIQPRTVTFHSRNRHFSQYREVAAGWNFRPSPYSGLTLRTGGTAIV